MCTCKEFNYLTSGDIYISIYNNICLPIYIYISIFAYIQVQAYLYIPIYLFDFIVNHHT